jgi:hypothetical protein
VDKVFMGQELSHQPATSPAIPVCAIDPKFVLNQHVSLVLKSSIFDDLKFYDHNGIQYFGVSQRTFSTKKVLSDYHGQTICNVKQTGVFGSTFSVFSGEHSDRLLFNFELKTVARDRMMIHFINQITGNAECIQVTMNLHSTRGAVFLGPEANTREGVPIATFNSAHNGYMSSEWWLNIPPGVDLVMMCIILLVLREARIHGY